MPDAPQTVPHRRIGTVRETPDFAALQVLNEAFGATQPTEPRSARKRLHLRHWIALQLTACRRPSPSELRCAAMSPPMLSRSVSGIEAGDGVALAANELKRARGSSHQSLPGMFRTNEATADSFGDLFVYAATRLLRKRPRQRRQASHPGDSRATLSRSGGNGGDSGRRPQEPRKHAQAAGTWNARGVADQRCAVLTASVATQSPWAVDRV